MVVLRYVRVVRVGNDGDCSSEVEHGQMDGCVRSMYVLYGDGGAMYVHCTVRNSPYR